MKRTPLALALLLAATGAVAFATYPSYVSVEESDFADQVSIFQNGFALVNLRLDVTGTAGLLQLRVPSSIVPSTLRFDGINVTKIDYMQETHPLLVKGDLIEVVTKQGTQKGVFVDSNEWLIISTGINQTVLINPQEILSIKLMRAAEVKPSQILINVTWRSSSGEHDVRVVYLARGPSWTPIYHLDVDTSWLQMLGVVESAYDWGNVSLKLVAGEPHVALVPIFYGPYGQSYDKMGLEAGEFDYSQISEFHEYVLMQRIDLYSGWTTRLLMFEGHVEARQEYYWSWGTVRNRYRIENTWDKPLAAGIIEFYKEGTWIGQDRIEYTAVGDEATPTANYAHDIKVSEVVNSTREPLRDVYEVEIEVKNFKQETVELTVEKSLAQFAKLLSADPQPEFKARTLTWKVTVEAQGSATIRYSYEIPLYRP